MSRDQRAGGPILGRGPKLIGSLIGAASEAYTHNKAKKEHERNQDTTQGSAYHDDEREEEHDADDDDEEDWALDDATGELGTEHGHHPHARPLDSSALAMPVSATRPLPCPVILPQRRPQTKSRGFVRAYAPLLGECKGIDEATFLTFLDQFYEKSQTSQVFQAINVGSMIVGSIPSVVAMAVSTAMSVAARTGTEAQSRYQTNTFLDQVNHKLFNPRNLQCVIMTYKPESSQQVVEVDINATNEALIKSMNTSHDSTMSKLKSVPAGTAKSEFAIPEAAPLIYPTIDKAAFAVSEDGKPLPAAKQNALKRSSLFIKDYLDRRAQAEFGGQYGTDSKLANPNEQQKFTSRYADPNHPANSGGILALLTGGAIDPRAKFRGRRAERRARMTGHELSEQDRQNIAMGRQSTSGRTGVVGTMRKVMHESVLYMLIAEIPSPQDMERLQARMQH